MKSMAYAYVGRKLKKREHRRLWIARINAGARLCDTNYSKLIHGLKLAGVEVNRKVLADLAITDMNAFNELCNIAKNAQ
jgi:large subunit ribosomal protein L20